MMCRVICVFVVRIRHEQVFRWYSSYNKVKISLNLFWVHRHLQELLHAIPKVQIWLFCDKTLNIENNIWAMSWDYGNTCNLYHNNLFVLRTLIPKTCMCSHPVQLDVRFWSDPSSTSILHVCEQQRLWWDWADAQARLSLRRSPMW